MFLYKRTAAYLTGVNVGKLIVWAAICRNEHFIKLHGLRELVSRSWYRQEVVGGNLLERLKSGWLRFHCSVDLHMANG